MCAQENYKVVFFNRQERHERQGDAGKDRFPGVFLGALGVLGG